MSTCDKQKCLILGFPIYYLRHKCYLNKLILMSTCDKQKCLILGFPIYYLHIYYLIQHSMTFPV